MGRKSISWRSPPAVPAPTGTGRWGPGGAFFVTAPGLLPRPGEISRQLEDAKARVAAKAGPGAKYIAYFQSFTNTYGPVKRLRKLYREAMAPEDVVILSVATRPDCLPQPVLELLAECAAEKEVWVELGLQTIHPASAAYLRRGYDLEVYDRAVEQLHQIGAQIVVHQILGLPGETEEMMAETARYIGCSGADGVKFHLLHVLRGTDLAEEWQAGRVPVMELETYLHALEACLRVLPREVVIHRLTRRWSEAGSAGTDVERRQKAGAQRHPSDFPAGRSGAGERLDGRSGSRFLI